MNLLGTAPIRLFALLNLLALCLLLPDRAAAAPPGDSVPVQSPTTPDSQPSFDDKPGSGDAVTAKETVCDDGEDNDGDTVYDCGDADCSDDPACKANGQAEKTAALCHDWVDNDENGYTDCEDFGCQNLDVCKGSWDREMAGKSVGGAGGTAKAGPHGDLTLGAGEVEEDLLGRSGDKDGERSNYSCSDGYDNDGDGFTDCDDLGCKLGTEVT
ncbi:MAG: hypothetical protein KC457_23220, partial [Myxococcales bacterium]|nr:hypothetical protein [Myxococcales bacterium]